MGQSYFVEPVREMLTRIMAYLPVLLGALLILIVVKIIRSVVNGALKVVHFDALSDKAGISEVLKKGDLKITARQVLSGHVYWLIIIMVLVMVANALVGLPKASDILSNLFFLS